MTPLPGPAHALLSCPGLVMAATVIDTLAKRERIYRVLELCDGNAAARRVLGGFAPGARWTRWEAGQWLRGDGAHDNRIVTEAPALRDVGLYDLLLCIDPLDPFDTERLRATIDRGLAVARHAIVLLPLAPEARGSSGPDAPRLAAHSADVFRSDLTRIALSVYMNQHPRFGYGLFLLSADRDPRLVLEMVGRGAMQAIGPVIGDMPSIADIRPKGGTETLAQVVAAIVAKHPVPA